MATAWWIPSSTGKRRTFHQTLCGIQPQEGGGRAPFDRHAENVRPFKAKMRRPQLCPGIEKRDERPGHGIEGTEIVSLPTITHRAGQGKILDDGLTTMFFAMT
jgi:hypothetical protein